MWDRSTGCALILHLRRHTTHWPKRDAQSKPYTWWEHDSSPRLSSQYMCTHSKSSGSICTASFGLYAKTYKPATASLHPPGSFLTKQLSRVPCKPVYYRHQLLTALRLRQVEIVRGSLIRGTWCGNDCAAINCVEGPKWQGTLPKTVRETATGSGGPLLAWQSSYTHVHTNLYHCTIRTSTRHVAPARYRNRG